ncbi:uncharacterized protein EV154DRAFT_571510, partial [Mucor mucedo]|uniref:uncharacterized protein n=1 Tax=Mucor mucedo TaxID=29922 RepID=UPI002220C07A
MSNINSSSQKRGPPTSISVLRKDITKPLTRNGTFKHVVADPEADFLHKKKIATATARRLAGSPDSPDSSSITFVSSGTIPNGQKPASSQASSAVPSATITELDDSLIMSSLDSSLPPVSPNIAGETLAFSIPEFALDLQQQLRKQARRLDEYETRLSAIDQILQENLQLKTNNHVLEKTIREQGDTIAALKAQLTASPYRPTDNRMQVDSQERDLSSNASIWSKAPPSSSSPKPTTTASTRPNVNKNKPTMAEIVAQKASKP